jgi:hypothetical protein
MRNVLFASVLAFGLAFVGRADVPLTVNETFASGATFAGQVTFLNDYSNVTAVDGVLSGGPYGTDPITWVWDPTINWANFSSFFGPQYGGNFLMDGTTCGNECGSYTYWVTFTWDFSAAPNLVLASPGGVLAEYGGNNVTYTDPLVSGTIGSAVPEPSAISMLVIVLAGLGGLTGLKKKLS